MKRTLKAPTEKDLKRFISLTSTCGYDSSGKRKQEYKNLGQRILRYIAQEMDLKEGEYEIRWNPGGVAVSGDHTLHTSKVYLAFHDNLCSGWFYYRSCNGLRDYSGGSNQIVHWNKLRNIQQLIDALKIMQNGYKDPSSGDLVFTPPIVERKAITQFNARNGEYPVFS